MATILYALDGANSSIYKYSLSGGTWTSGIGYGNTGWGTGASALMPLNLKKNSTSLFAVAQRDTVGAARLYKASISNDTVWTAIKELSIYTNSQSYGRPLAVSDNRIAVVANRPAGNPSYYYTSLISLSTNGGTSFTDISVPALGEDSKQLNLAFGRNYLYICIYGRKASNPTGAAATYLIKYNLTTSTLDGEASYVAVDTARFNVYAEQKLVVIPAASDGESDIVYCLTDDNLKKSTNNGTTFTTIKSTNTLANYALNNNQIGASQGGTRIINFNSIAAEGSKIYIAIYARLFSWNGSYYTESGQDALLEYSNDGGATWGTKKTQSGNYIVFGGAPSLQFYTENSFFWNQGLGSSYPNNLKLFTWSGSTLTATSGYNSAGGFSNFSKDYVFIPDNTAPTEISFSSSASVTSASIAETAAANATVGTLYTTDAEGGAMTYALVAGTGSTDNASFMIVGSALKLANGVSLDYEAKSLYSVRVQATDAGGLTYAQALTINVSNVNEAPSNINLSASSIQEGNAVNAVIGTLSAIDPDTGDTSFTFSITGGADQAKFNISGNSLRASEAFDYEAPADANGDNVYSVDITATDAGGLSYAKSFNITVVNSTSDDPVFAPATIVLTTGRVVIRGAANNPTANPSVLSNGNQLPSGSVVIMTDSSKFVKFSGSVGNFLPINSVPPAQWGWSEEGVAAWETLKNI